MEQVFLGAERYKHKNLTFSVTHYKIIDQSPLEDLFITFRIKPGLQYYKNLISNRAGNHVQNHSQKL